MPAKLARVYMHCDRKAMDSGKPLVDLVEPPSKAKSSDVRIVTTKIPLKAPDGTVVGLVGIARNLMDAAKRPLRVSQFSKIIDRLEDPDFKRYDSGALARLQGMSKSKFEREFKKLFQMSPAAYHLQTRLRWARNDLLYTMNSISQIAFDHGFCDQSHFTKRFVSAFGITPPALPQKGVHPPSGGIRHVIERRGSAKNLTDRPNFCRPGWAARQADKEDGGNPEKLIAFRLMEWCAGDSLFKAWAPQWNFASVSCSK